MYGKYPPYLILSSRHFGSSLRGLLLNVHPLRAQPFFFWIIEHVWQIPALLDTFFQTQPFLSHLSSLPKEHSLFVGRSVGDCVGCIVGSSVGDTVGGSDVGALVDGLLAECRAECKVACLAACKADCKAECEAACKADCKA